MRLKDVLADHLKGLLGASKYDTLPKITAASRDRLTNGTLDRIRRATSEAGIDKLEELADVFRIQPWLLMVPGVKYVQGEDGFPLVANAPEISELIESQLAGSVYVRYRTEGYPSKGLKKVAVKVGTTAPPPSAQKQAVLDALIVKTGSQNDAHQPYKVPKQGTNRRT